MYVSIIQDYSVGGGENNACGDTPPRGVLPRKKKFTCSEVSEVASSPLKLATIDY